MRQFLIDKHSNTMEFRNREDFLKCTWQYLVSWKRVSKYVEDIAKKEMYFNAKESGFLWVGIYWNTSS